MQNRLPRRMGVEEEGGLTLPQPQQVPPRDAVVRRLWGEPGGNRIAAQDPASAFLISCCCLEKWFGRGYQFSWLSSFWENRKKRNQEENRLFPGAFLQDSLTGSKWVATWTAPCADPWSVSGDKWHSSVRARLLLCPSNQQVFSVTPQQLLWNAHKGHRAQLNLVGWGWNVPAKPPSLAAANILKINLFVSCFLLSPDSIMISPKDVQWVGAWWLGYLIAGVISVLAGIPFWFLPKHLPKPESRKDSSTSSEHSKFIIEENKDQGTSHWQRAKLAEMAKGKAHQFSSWLLSFYLKGF